MPKDLGQADCQWCGSTFARRKYEQRFCDRACAARWRQHTLPSGINGRGIQVPDDVIRAAVNDINSGTPWHVAMRRHGVSQKTIDDRAAQRGWQIRRGLRPTILPAAIKLPTAEGDLGYLAGIIDGEGNISRTKPPRSQEWTGGRVAVFNTDTGLMDWLAAMGGRIADRTRSGTLGTKPCFAWTVSNRSDVDLLLRTVRPYMRIKGHLADQILAIYEARTVEVRRVAS